MKTKDVVTLAAVGVGIWWVWSRFPSMGPPSQELMQYRGQQVNPPIWQTWGQWYQQYIAQGYEPVSAEEAARTAAVADQLNADLGWSPTRGGIW